VTPEAFELFSARLRENLATRPDVLGLVLMGSTAARHRVDEWSDHDFAVVAVDGEVEAVRSDLCWLPDAGDVALSVREDHDGHKVVYDDGHVLEFGVTTIDGLRHWHANAYDVVLDGGGVTQAFDRVAARDKPGASATAGRELGLFVTLLLIGTGRCRRGEVLVAGQLIRTYAVAHLITAWRLLRPAEGADRLDDLDPFRRFEQVYPGPGAAIAAALERDVEAAARRLLDLAEEEFGRERHFPARAATAVRRRLEWSRP
jgi:hypothetical protein